MVSITTTILAFILTALIGNRYLVAWQYRSWTRQQGLLGKEKQYLALQQLSADLSRIIGKRLYRMERLLSSIGSGDIDRVEIALARYDESLIEWNESFNELAARLTILSSFQSTKQLEQDIQQPFREVGVRLESMVRQTRQSVEVTKMDRRGLSTDLHKIQINVANFDRDMIRTLDEKRISTYFPTTVSYSRWTLDQFSTFELIQALTISDVDRHTVERAP